VGEGGDEREETKSLKERGSGWLMLTLALGLCRGWCR
jgi:hypothetical protein